MLHGAKKEQAEYLKAAMSSKALQPETTAWVICITPHFTG